MADPFSGPIPGENFTSDVRNYPWHRPPEYTSPDDAIEYLSKTFTREESIAAVVSMLEIGLDVATITDLIITKGIGEGKWAVDLGLIIAGPVAHMVVIIAKGFGVSYELGVKEGFKAPTSTFFKTVEKTSKNNAKAKEEVIKNIESKAEMGGFMAGLPSSEEIGEVETDEDTEMM